MRAVARRRVDAVAVKSRRVETVENSLRHVRPDELQEPRQAELERALRRGDGRRRAKRRRRKRKVSFRVSVF